MYIQVYKYIYLHIRICVYISKNSFEILHICGMCMYVSACAHTRCCLASDSYCLRRTFGALLFYVGTLITWQRATCNRDQNRNLARLQFFFGVLLSHMKNQKLQLQRHEYRNISCLRKFFGVMSARMDNQRLWLQKNSKQSQIFKNRRCQIVQVILVCRWQAYCWESKHRLVVYRICTRKRVRRLVSYSFRRLLAYCKSQRKYHRLFVYRFCTRTRVRRLVSNSFRRLLTYGKSHRKKVQNQHIAEASALRKILSHCLQGWLMVTLAVRRERVAVQAHHSDTERQRLDCEREDARYQRNSRLVQSRLACACKNRLVLFVFTSWTRVFFEWQWKQHVLCGAFERLTLTRQRGDLIKCVFSSWQDFLVQCHYHNHLRKGALNFFLRINSLLLVTSIERWQEQACKQRRVDIICARACKHWMTRKISEAFTSWFEEYETAKRHMAVDSKVCLQWKKKTIIAVWDRWVAQIELFNEERATLERVLLRINYTVTSRSFRCWGLQVQLFTKQRETLECILSRMPHVSMARAYDVWMLHVKLLNVQRTELQRVLLRVVHNLAIAGAMDRWKNSIKEEKQIRFKNLLRWMKVGLSIVFDTLKERAVELKGMRNAGEKVQYRWQRMVFFQGFCGWSQHASCQRHLATVSAKLTKKFLGYAIRSSMENWIEYASERLRLKNKIYKIVKRMLDCMISSSLIRWREYTTEQSVLQKKATRIVFHVLNHILTLAFITWSCSTEMLRRIEDARIKLNFQQRSHTLMSGFETWQDTTHEIRMMDMKSIKIIRRLRKQLLVTYCSAWRGNVALAVEVQNMAQYTLLAVRSVGRWLAAISKTDRVRAGALLFERGLDIKVLARSLERWHERLTPGNLLWKNEVTMTKCRHAARMLRSLCGWADVAHSSQWQNLQLQNYRKRWNNAILGSFYGWADVAHSSKRQNLQLQYYRKRCNAARLRSFDEWVDFAHSSKRQNLQLQIHRKRWNTAIPGSFNTWVDAAHFSNRQKLQLQDYRKRWNNAIRESFNGRANEAEDLKRRRLKLLHFSTCNLAVMVLRKWCSLLSFLQQARETANETSGYFRVSSLLFVLEEWKMSHAIRKQLRVRLLRAKQTVGALRICDKQEHWHAVAREEKRLRYKMIKCISRLLHPQLSRSLLRWMAFLFSVHRARDAAHNALQRVVRFGWVCLIECWRKIVSKRRLMQKSLQSAARNRGLFEMKWALRKWDHEATTRMRHRFHRFHVLAEFIKAMHGQDHLRLARQFYKWGDAAHSSKSRTDVLTFLNERGVRNSLAWMLSAWRIQVTRLELVCAHRIAALQDRIAVRVLSAAVRAWNIVTSENHDDRVRAIGLEWKLCKVRLAIRFNKWKEFVDMRLALDDDQVESRLQVFSERNRYWTAMTTHIFHLWKQEWERVNHLRVLHTHFIIRSFVNWVRRVFNRMKTQTQLTKSFCTFSFDFQIRLEVVFLSKVYLSWAEFLTRKRIQDTLELRVQIRQQSRLQRRVLAHWTISVRGRIELVAKTHKLQELFRLKHIAASFMFMVGSLRKNKKARHANELHSMELQATHHVTYIHALIGAMMMKIRRRSSSRSLFDCFGTWTLNVETSRLVQTICCRITTRQRYFLLLATLQALNAHVQNGQLFRSAYIILSHIQSSHIKRFFDTWRHAIVVQQLVQLQLLSNDQGVINRRSVVNGAGTLIDATRNRQLLHQFWNLWMLSIFRLRDRQLSACKLAHDKIVELAMLVLYFLKAHAIRVNRATLMKM